MHLQDECNAVKADSSLSASAIAAVEQLTEATIATFKAETPTVAGGLFVPHMSFQDAAEMLGAYVNEHEESHTGQGLLHSLMHSTRFCECWTEGDHAAALDNLFLAYAFDEKGVSKCNATMCSAVVCEIDQNYKAQHDDFKMLLLKFWTHHPAWRGADAVGHFHERLRLLNRAIRISENADAFSMEVRLRPYLFYHRGCEFMFKQEREKGFLDFTAALQLLEDNDDMSMWPYMPPVSANAQTRLRDYMILEGKLDIGRALSGLYHTEKSESAAAKFIQEYTEGARNDSHMYAVAFGELFLAKVNLGIATGRDTVEENLHLLEKATAAASKKIPVFRKDTLNDHPVMTYAKQLVAMAQLRRESDKYTPHVDSKRDTVEENLDLLGEATAATSKKIPPSRDDTLDEHPALGHAEQFVETAQLCSESGTHEPCVDSCSSDFVFKPRCWGCNTAADCKLCGGCKVARYCSKPCQLSDRKNHKSQCGKIAMENGKSADLVIETVCCRVMAAWEETQPHFGTQFVSTEFLEHEYTVEQKEAGVLSSFKSIGDWAPGLEPTADVWRAYWIARTHHNSSALACGLLKVLQSIAQQGTTLACTDLGDILVVASAKTVTHAMHLHKVGTLKVQNGIDACVPAIKGDDVWHSFVTVSTNTGKQVAIDVACAQYGIFGSQGQPFLVCPVEKYFQIICRKQVALPRSVSFDHPFVQGKANDLLHFFTENTDAAIPMSCPFDPMSIEGCSTEQQAPDLGKVTLHGRCVNEENVRAKAMAPQIVVCANLCCSMAAPNLRCSKCKITKYCNSACQREAWPIHKLECFTPAETTVKELLETGALHSGQQKLLKLPSPCARLDRMLVQLIEMGIHSELVDDLIELRDIPGKGLGYIATAHIEQGTVILYDTAFVSTRFENSAEQNAKQVLEKVSAEEPHEIRAFFEDTVLPLCPHGRWDLSGITDLMSAHQFQCSAEPEATSFFPAASHFNHSCCPNAFVDCTEKEARVRAISPICADQEVTIGFVSILSSFTDRRQSLYQRGIVCSCARCVSELQMDMQDVVVCCKNPDDPTSLTSVFSVRPNSNDHGRECPNCHAVFNLYDTQQLRLQVEQANTFMCSPEASLQDPRVLLSCLEKILIKVDRGPCQIPDNNVQKHALINNIANCHFFCATRISTSVCSQEYTSYMESFVRLKIRHLKAMELINYGKPPPDVAYIRSLWRLLQGKFTLESQRVEYQSKLEEVSRLLFGQSTPPQLLVANINAY